ncbi:hypothetical protein ACFL5D_04385 [Candidatus Neomarinimicrobiota bacterium]
MSKKIKNNNPSAFKPYPNSETEKIANLQIEYNKLKLRLSSLLLDSDPNNKMQIEYCRERIFDIEHFVNNERLIIEDQSSKESHPVLRYVIREQYPKVDSKYSQGKQKIDISDNKQTKDDGSGMYNKYGYAHKEWQNYTKQKQVEILANMARKDIENSPQYWHIVFKAEFPKGYSVELGRYKGKWERKNRYEIFKINGLMFYKSKV